MRSWRSCGCARSRSGRRPGSRSAARTPTARSGRRRSSCARRRCARPGHRLLMEALAARGEVAEALAAYERLRVLLREEGGRRPARRCGPLHERLLNGDAPTAPPVRDAPTGSPTGSPQSRAPARVDQEIRFCTVDGARLAYATVGQGPALVLPALWISHLELEWGLRGVPDVRGGARPRAHRDPLRPARHRAFRPRGSRPRAGRWMPERAHAGGADRRPWGYRSSSLLGTRSAGARRRPSPPATRSGCGALSSSAPSPTGRRSRPRRCARR